MTNSKIKISEQAYIALTNAKASENAYRMLNDIAPLTDSQEERDLLYQARMALIELKAMYALSLDIEE